MWWKLNNPPPEQVKQARENTGLTQSQAAAVIYKKLLAWQRYESGDRSMDYALYELFMLKTGQMKL
jgi:transcriptional regulator with XRE-family HTH domain